MTKPDADAEKTTPTKRGGPRDAAVATLLILCVLLVAFWEVMSNRSERPFDAFQMRADDFVDFQPVVENWTIEQLPVSDDPIEPNILVYLLRPEAGGRPLLVRLVHGYNMVDCMRIKGDAVSLLADTRRELDGSPVETSTPVTLSPDRQVQLWRLLSPTGHQAIWMTSMLRMGDFAETAVDTRAMAFPRVGIPDHPGWFPQGLSAKSLRHPVRNLRLFMRAKWNSSRADVLTFLKLKRPAWASEDLLTMVVATAGPPVAPGDEQAAIATIIGMYDTMHRQLQEWRRQRNQ
ncbi:MAG: hypothetical protein O3A51_14630 [Verrucomicrobia bacterium]|nr:hypothetical protein [Verrucomicrobiota bacterium]